MFSMQDVWRGYRRFKYEGPIIDKNSKATIKTNWVTEINVKDTSDPLVNLAHQYKVRNGINKNVRLELPGKLIEISIFNKKRGRRNVQSK